MSFTKMQQKRKMMLDDLMARRNDRLKQIKNLAHKIKIKPGTNIDRLRKEIFQEILLTLLKEFNPVMKKVPCKDHLFEKGMKIEKTLFKRATFETYTDVNTLEIIAKGLAGKDIIETIKVPHL